MPVPFVDLRAQYHSIKAEIDAAIAGVLADGEFVRGSHVKEFERAFARLVGARHCVGCGNGTDALFIALKMLGVGPGDEVLVPAISWIATSEAVTLAGASPVFVDLEDAYLTLSPEDAARKVTSRTKAVVPVHLYGQPADMPALAELCAAHNLMMVEDCAQAHMATLGGRVVGTFGRVGAFSFYPSKNLGAYGDGGCLLTEDGELAERMRMYANHGTADKVDHAFEGINSRLDGLQAAILLAKLPRLPEWTRMRRAHARRYNERLEGVPGVRTPAERPGAEHVYHVYAVRVGGRDAVAARLRERGIATAIHYPRALPFLTAYRHLGHTPSDFPVAHACQETLLSLPMYPELADEQVDEVAAALAAAAGQPSHSKREP